MKAAPVPFIQHRLSRWRPLMLATLLVGQLLCAAFLYVLGRAHWFVNGPDMAYFANLLVPPESRALILWGTILVALSAVYVVDVVMALFLIWTRAYPQRWQWTREQLSRRSGLRSLLSSIGNSETPSVHEFREKAGAPTESRILTKPALRPSRRTFSQSLHAVILQVFGHQGWLGIDNPKFSSVFACRELLEIIAQCVQLERTHALISRRWINQVFSVFAILDCWSTPLIEHTLRHQPAIVPLVCVLVDVVLAMGTCVVLPAIIFLPYVVAFDWPTRSFSMEMMYNDELYVQLVMENRMVFFVSTLDGITSTIPHVGILASLRATRGCIDRLTQTTAKQRSLGRLASVRVAVAPSNPVASAVRPHPAPPRRFLSAIHVIMGAIGVALIGVEFHSSAIQTPMHAHSCQAHVHPWFASKASCSIFKYNCLRSNATTPSDASFDNLDLNSLLVLIIAHCRELRVPRAFGSLHSLVGFEIYNSTIETWDASAAINYDVHRRLSYLAVVRSNMSEFPVGLYQRLPKMLLDIELIATNLSTVPDTLDSLWQPLSILYIERSLFTEIPGVLRRLRVFDFSFAGNLVETLPDDFFEGSDNQFWLWLAGNPLRELPDHANAALSIAFLSLENTRVTTLPPWVFSVVSRRVFVGGSPLCDDTPRANRSIVDCSVLPERSQGRYPFPLVTKLRVV
ncbi:hypothetical protein P43SY_009546 [Pythium insidiosum]|uniref:Uncharacterized protein n=1 Tax=Pythium insidiosum TaxID=114742 RepID=A0AAD5LLV9_PYTIN|nr:hypothetical protein P43SY_009546 [Pythium insidiosum]